MDHPKRQRVAPLPVTDNPVDLGDSPARRPPSTRGAAVAAAASRNSRLAPASSGRRPRKAPTAVVRVAVAGEHFGDELGEVRPVFLLAGSGGGPGTGDASSVAHITVGVRSGRHSASFGRAGFRNPLPVPESLRGLLDHQIRVFPRTFPVGPHIHQCFTICCFLYPSPCYPVLARVRRVSDVYLRQSRPHRPRPPGRLAY